MSFYLVPIETVAGIFGPTRQPKYVPALGVAWAMVDFGESAIVWAAASSAQDTAMAAHADATVVPTLDNTIVVNATQNALETLNIPGQWLNASMTYRTVLRVVVGMAQLVQRVRGLGSSFNPAGNLDKTLAQIPADVRNNIATACDQLGIDRSGFTGTTTVREVLRSFGQQFAAGATVTLGDL